MPLEMITKEIYGSEMTFMNKDYLILTLKDRRLINKYIDLVCKEKDWNKEEADELIASGDLEEDFWINQIIAYLIEIKVCETLCSNLKMYYRLTENV